MLLLVLSFAGCETELGPSPTDSATAAHSPTESPATNETPQTPPNASDGPDVELPDDLPQDPADCLNLAFAEQAPCLGLTDEELVLFLSQDADGDGSSNLMEATNGTDPFDPRLGADTDGDGIQNRDDSDVDGDGEDNGEDSDIDGDGKDNGDDEDVDGDGEDTDEDEDDDGDGIDDEDDTDDDNDGEDDCGCEHGLCSSFGGLCFCHKGWEGEDCDEPHCKDVQNCNFGFCIGPNICRCKEGWQPDSGTNPCINWHCAGVNDCSGHGTCVGPNDCDCDPKWDVRLDCSVPTCKEDSTICDDLDPCTKDSCDNNALCHHDPLCTAPQVCENGTCGEPCRDVLDCQDGKGCRGGGCFECTSDKDCSDLDPCTTETCNSSTGCRPGGPKPCPVQGEECVLGRCVKECLFHPCDQGQTCHSEGGCFDECDEGDCPEDEVCEDDACVPIGCESDSDCTLPKTCEDGVCKTPLPVP